MKRLTIAALLLATPALAQPAGTQVPSDRAMAAAGNQMLLQALDSEEKATAALLDAKQQVQQAQAQLAQVTRERDEARAELAKVKAVPKKP
jgi:hypothetical protein